MDRFLFIRHSVALERDEWEGDDMLRPLSKKGVKVAQDMCKKLPKIYEIDLIVSSEAQRALQTARILKEYYPNADFIINEKLNPGCTFEHFDRLLDDLVEFPEVIAFVGHEPDFSEIISEFITESYIRMRLKKPSLVEVEMLDQEIGELRAFLTPKLVKNL